MNYSQSKTKRSSNKEITVADSVADKARKARNRANDENFSKGASYKTEDIVMDLTRGKKSIGDKIMGRYPDASERKAAKVVQQRRRTDTAKTASRATAIEKRTIKKAAEAKVRAGVSGGTPKKQAPKASAKKTNAKKSGKK
jgi:class 3 adenylate cyclase